MEERQSSSRRNDQVIDAKPLRSLVPMSPVGFNASSTFGPLPSGVDSWYPPGFSPLFPNPPHTHTPVPKTSNKGSAHVGEGSNASAMVILLDDDDEGPLPSCRTSASGQRIKRAMHFSSCSSSGSKTVGRKVMERKKQPRKAYDHSLALPISSSSSHSDPRESVEAILMKFDALRRRLLQLDDAKKEANRRPDLKAGTILMGNDIRANMGKRIGLVPGIEVGDIFYFRIEMCLVGLHAPSMGGIDFITARFANGEDPVAISIVSAGVYENVEDGNDVLIYSGQGGGGCSSKKLGGDQKLEKGNLALERGLSRGNEIRVVRSAKDLNVPNGRIYIYDGLYKIHESWAEKSKAGFNVFKYRLLREPGQPDGIAVWKMTQKWRENPSSRGRVIMPDISSGAENIPVCVVNDVDDEKGPSYFTYVTRVKYLRPIISSSMKPLQHCVCMIACLPEDADCYCARENGGDLPYSSTGILVSRKPMIYECNASCQCSVDCRNRVTQKGIRLHFEVFRTRGRGWGLRSWDPIRAGSFICEYTGEVIDVIDVDDNGAEEEDEEEEEEYIFRTTSGEKSLNWNYEPGLLGETGSSTDLMEALPMIISAKYMGNISRFMNHSCSPNVFWQPIQHGHGDEGYPHIIFFAIKHIPPMTELTYDYGLSQAGYGAKKCLCGSSKCRGLFG